MATNRFESNFTGETVPTSNYVNSISENFPSPTRFYKIDAGVSQRSSRDYLPINANVNTNSVNDSYLEYIIHPSDREFINIENVFLELKLNIVSANGETLGDTARVSVIDGVGHNIIARSTVYLNSVVVESNPYKGLWEYIKTITGVGVNEQHSILRANYYKNITEKCTDVIETTYFQDDASNNEKEIIADVKRGLHLMVPINLNISSSDFYLLDNVELRIRIDLNPASYILSSDQANQLYAYKISLAKLHLEKIIPHPNALVSLNKTMLTKNTSIEYVVDNPIIKTYVYPTGYTTLTVDNAFNGFIPNKLYVFFVSQTALNGDYTRNPSFLQNCKLTSIRVDINGNIHSHLTGSFPHNITQYFIKSLMGIGHEKTLLTYDNYKSGRTIYVFDLSNTDSSDCINIQKRGNLKISIQSSTAVTENMVLFLVGVSNGTVFINTDRVVKTSF